MCISFVDFHFFKVKMYVIHIFIVITNVQCFQVFGYSIHLNVIGLQMF